MFRRSMQRMNRAWQPKFETLEARRLLSTAYADFNGDGFSDLAVGVPGEAVNSAGSAGAVNVIYGSAAGLTSTNNQLWHQDLPGILDTADVGDRFGHALAPGDFNNDGFDDLAIGIPGESDSFATGGAGAVQILYGTVNGLSADGNQIWSQDSPRIREIAEAGDRFGTTVTAGDFNSDGFSDLAIGVPFEDIGVLANTGLVHVLYGRAGGIKPPDNRIFTLDFPGIDGEASADAHYATALAVGDFTGDGFMDLAVGIPRADTGDSPGGAASVMHGSLMGITVSGNNFLTSNLPFDIFGGALAASDFTGDGKDDLAIGAPGHNANSQLASGAVYVVFGDSAGLSMTNSDFHIQSDVPGQLSEAHDAWGQALAAADIDNDGFVDLAVGAPFEEVGGVSNAGIVNVLYGTSMGLDTSVATTVTQESTGTGNTSETSDFFGIQLCMGDYDGDGEADLTIAATFEDVGSIEDAGSVFVLYGAGFLNGQEWNQDSLGIEGTAAAGEGFGTGIGGW